MLVVALVLLPAAWRVLPGESPAGVARFDLPGGIFLGLGAGLVLFGVTQAQVAGFTAPSSWARACPRASTCDGDDREHRQRGRAQPHHDPPALLLLSPTVRPGRVRIIHWGTRSAHRPEGPEMSGEDKARNKAEELKGKAKEGLGKATGNEQWEAEGKGEQGKADVKQAGEKVKDAAKDVFDR